MISSDAFPPYVKAIKDAFGDNVHYGQIVKKYAGEPAKDAARRYSPDYVVSVERSAVIGKPVRFLTSTSYVERSNLTFRMQQRRFTRMTNAFSKKLENHKAAVALFVAHYNLCRVHKSLRITPAMQLGITDHIWTIGELVEAALHGDITGPQGKQIGPFRAIDSGVS